MGESEIRIEPKHAELVVKKKKQSGNFVIETKIRGTAHVTFTNIHENNSLLKPVSGDIAYIFNKYLEQKQKIGDSFDFVTVHDDIVFIKSKRAASSGME